MVKCNICSQEFENPYRLVLHRREAHPETRRPKKVEKPADSGLNKILDAQKAIKDGIADLEREREELHKRVLLIDDLVVKYKKLL